MTNFVIRFAHDEICPRKTRNFKIVNIARTSWMPRFKPNDRVFILPKYAHLYPETAAMVIGVTSDLFRPMFNEYTIQFGDHSTANLFEFQVIEELANYKTYIASVVFDSHQQTTQLETRSQSYGRRQILLQTPEFDLNMGISTSMPAASIMGQVLRRNTKEMLSHFDVALMTESTPILTSVSDALGVFKFGHVPYGSLNILVTIHRDFSRILGAFSI